MEVIARKKASILPLFIVALVLGGLLLLGGVVCFVVGGYSIIPAIVLTVLGVAAASIAVLAWRLWKKTPTEIVCLENDTLHILGGSYAVTEIINVTYRYPLGISKIGWGKLGIEMHGKKCVCYFVDDVVDVQQRLLSLRLSDCNAPIDR